MGRKTENSKDIESGEGDNCLSRISDDKHRITIDVVKQCIENYLFSSSTSSGGVVGEVIVKRFYVSRGSKPADNFACEVIRVDAIYSVAGAENADEEKFTWFAKQIPSNPVRAKWLIEAGLHQREVDFYIKIAPEMQKIGDTFLNQTIQIPDNYYHSDMILCLEDLKLKGFELVDREKGMNIEEVLMVIDQLALFHATTFYFVENQGLQTFKEKYGYLIYDGWIPSSRKEESDKDAPPNVNEETEDATTGPDAVGQFFKTISMFGACSAEIVRGELPDNLISSLSNFFQNVKERMESALPSSSTDGTNNEFKCIIHNDPWYNNFMFRTNPSTKEKEIKVIDMQIIRYAKPAVDLVYFLSSSTTPKFRSQYFEYVMEYYHQKFCTYMTKFMKSPLGVKVSEMREVKPEKLLTLDQLYQDYASAFAFGLSVGLLHTHLCVCPQNFVIPDNLTEEKMVNWAEDSAKRQIESGKSNPELKERLIGLILEAERYNVI